jgi:6-phosphofructokinase 2
VIATITLNPAIDFALSVDRFVVGGTNRCKLDAVDAGGKGINASRVVHRLGRRTMAYGFAGGETGNLLRRFLDAERVPYDFEPLAEMTRIDIMVYVGASGQRSRLLLPGARVGSGDFENLRVKLAGIGANATVVLGGSLPPGLDPDVYTELIEAFRARGVQTILDTSGEALAAALQARPALIKPNVEEAAEVLGRTLCGDAEILEGALELQRRGACSVVISQGADGAIGVGPEGAFKAIPPPIEARSTVGSGDSMVAGLAIAVDERLGLQTGLRIGTAAGAATASISGTHLCDAAMVARLEPIVVIAPMPPAGVRATA